jgi:hypothetical protein
MSTLVSRLVLPLVLVAGVAPAWAQNSLPPAEISVGVSRLAPVTWDWVTDELRQPTLDLRFTKPLTPRFAVEGVFTVGQRDTGFATRTEGLYLVQIRQRLVRAERGNLKPFLTYGAVGYHSHLHQRAFTLPGPDGEPYSAPEYTYREFEYPLLTALGGGLQYDFSRHAGVRTDVQLVTLLYYPVGARASVGVTIPFGSYDRR